MPKRNRMNFDKHYDAIVLGGGPAGLAAGIYLSRARMKTLIISEGTVGGQMILTHEIANYPGVESISGYQLATIMKKQAKSFGCDMRSNVSVKSLDLDGSIKSLSLTDGSLYTAYSIILAPGGRSRTLNVPGEDTFRGKGISYCATCDGDFFTGKEIVVVGGGNSALEEAVSLTKYASKVTIVHQFDHFQAFEHAINEARSNPKISFILESAITEFHGTDSLKSVSIKNIRTGEIRNFPADGTFIFIGYLPNTEFLKGKIDLNPAGEIIVKNDMSTDRKGVYAAGDSIAKRYRQITTAVSDGTIAALAASEYLNKLKKEEKQFISN
jgi:thioredoxin reductase (NADPH)